MKFKILTVFVLSAWTVCDLAAMPSQEESGKASPIVRKLMTPEWMALKSGKKTRGEVAEVALRLARESDTEAAKLLLMKGAFVLYVKDGQTDKAVETMNAIETTIADLPPQSVTNMIEFALLGMPNVVRTRLYRRFDTTKAVVPSAKNRTTIQSIIDGMIKVPGRDCWLSETELTQGQWEAVMGYNPSSHKGIDLPVENVSVDNCDVFLEKLNQTPAVKASQFVFRLPTYGEWGYAAQAGASGEECWIKPGLVGDILDMAWVQENSSNQTHAVATKAPNAFGFYDMLGNVGEWMSGRDANGKLRIRGRSFNFGVDAGWHFLIGRYVYFGNSNRKCNDVGLRLAATVKPRRLLGSLLSRRNGKKEGTQLQATVDGYTWSYRLEKGEVTIESGVQDRCAISPAPVGHVAIPEMIEGVRVTRIGQWALMKCKGMTSVAIPTNVVEIANNAFNGCEGLTSITIPHNITSIGVGAFGGCRHLASISFSPNLTSIGDYAFWDCQSLTTLTVPSKWIGGHAFGACGKLASVALSSNVEGIGSDAFVYCGELTGFTVAPDNTKFTSIDGLLYTKDHKELVLCPGGLASVTVPFFVNKVLSTAFIGCPKLKQINVDKGNPDYVSVDGVLYTKNMETLVSCPSGKASVEVPFGVTAIGSVAFSRNSELESVKLSSSVTNIIGYHAFSSCGKLREMTVPAQIGWGAFDCAGIESVRILASAKRIDDCAFLHCRRLKSVTIEEGVTWIGGSAFAACSSLKSLVLPASVTNIVDNAFGECGSLTSVTISGERPAAGKAIFANCNSLKAIHVSANAKSWAGMKDWQGKPLAFDNKATIDGYVWSYYVKDGEATIVTVRGVGADAMMPESKGHLTIPSSIAGVKVTGLGTHAFWVCRDMKLVTIPDSVTCIYSLAFRDCRLKSVSIPASVTNMEGVPFYANRELTSFSVDASNPAYASVNGMLCTKDGALLMAGVNGDVEIPSCVTRISNHAFVDRSELTSVTIPSTVTNIGPCAFWNCHGLKSVTIPSGVACIEENAFRDCIGLTAVTIQPNVKSINRCAFVGCHELTTVAILGERPNAEEDCRLFDNCPKLTAIHVPSTAKSWAGMKEWQGMPLVFDAKEK